MFNNINELTYFATNAITDPNCTICLDPLDRTNGSTIVAHAANGGENIFHTFHLECINFWMATRHTCPLCAMNITHVNGVPVPDIGPPQPAVQMAQPLQPRLETTFLRGDYSEELNLASASGDLDRVNLLLENGASNEVRSNALLMAARYAHPEMARQANVQHAANANHLAVINSILANAELSEESRIGAIGSLAFGLEVPYDQLAMITAIEAGGPVSQELKGRSREWTVIHALAMNPPYIAQAVLLNILAWTQRENEQLQPLPYYRGEVVVKAARDGTGAYRDMIHSALQNGPITEEHRQMAINAVRERMEQGIGEHDQEVINLLENANIMPL